VTGNDPIVLITVKRYVENHCRWRSAISSNTSAVRRRRRALARPRPDR